MLDKGMMCILGGMEQDDSGFHHATQNSAQFKTYKFLDFSMSYFRAQLTTRLLQSQKANHEQGGTTAQRNKVKNNGLLVRK